MVALATHAQLELPCLNAFIADVCTWTCKQLFHLVRGLATKGTLLFPIRFCGHEFSLYWPGPPLWVFAASHALSIGIQNPLDRAKGFDLLFTTEGWPVNS
jgi:hypothetical protein